MAAEHPVTIYALVDPRDDTIRYIGQTRQTLERRLAQHMSERGTGRKSAWIAELATIGLRPLIRVLEVAPPAQAHAAERRVASEVMADGGTLTNGELQPAPPPRPQQDEIRYTLRLPRELYEQLRAQADAEGFSLHAAMLQALHAYARKGRRVVRVVR